MFRLLLCAQMLARAPAGLDTPSGCSEVRGASFRPFAKNQTAAFAYPSTLAPEWAARTQNLKTSLGDDGIGGWAACAGFSYNALGLALSHARRSAARMDAVLEILSCGTRSSQRKSTRTMLEHDLAYRKVSRESRALHRGDSSAAMHALSRNGYAAVIDSSWGLAAVLSGGLLERIHGRLRAYTKKSGVAIYNVDAEPPSFPHPPGMRRLLDLLLPRLTALATSYMGPTLFRGYTLLRLPGRLANLDSNEYNPILWHHDRCGRRLKCFIFLQNVTAQSHPLRIARGSQRTLYYSYDNVIESRFAARYVTQNYEVHDVLGGFGDGVCFDTNAIHQGGPDGTVQRDVMVLEFNMANKSRELASADDFIVASARGHVNGGKAPVRPATRCGIK